MALPFILPPGVVSIYGAGSESGISGVIPGNTDYKFGVVDEISNGGSVNSKVGQSVMFYKPNILYTLTYSGQIYTIIEDQKIQGIESPAP